MGLFNFSSVKCGIRYLNALPQKQIEFCFLAPNYRIKIVCDITSSTEQVILSCFVPHLGKFVDLVYGVKDFVDDVKNILKIFEKTSKGEDFLYDAFDKFVKRHVKEFHRIIDTDLFRIISEFMLVICDLSLQKGIRLSVSDKVDISKSFVDRVLMGNFAPYYYVTRYRQNGGNWEPYLEKYL